MPQKQLSRGVLMKRCSEIMQQFSRRTSKTKSESWWVVSVRLPCMTYICLYMRIISFMINDEKCKINVAEKYIVMAFLSSFFV